MRVGEWYADVGRWPLAVIRLHGAELDPEPEFETFAQAIDVCLDRRESCVIVMNLTGAKPDASRRRRVAELMDSRRELVQTYVDAAALVVPSALQRGVLTAVRWLNPHPYDLDWDTFSTEGAAVRWLERRNLARTGSD